jgi:hypothetical protein
VTRIVEPLLNQLNELYNTWPGDDAPDDAVIAWAIRVHTVLGQEVKDGPE